MVLDTPYYCIENLVREAMKNKFHIPNILCSSVLKYLKTKFSELLGEDIFKLNLLEPEN